MVGADREWRDIPAAIFYAAFGVVLLTLLVLLTPHFFDAAQSPKKLLGSAMIVLVLSAAAARSLRSAWNNAGGSTSIRRLASWLSRSHGGEPSQSD